MARPEGWVGSDLRARADVVRWLHDHGDEVHDPSGLLVGRIRDELGKGRALSQLVGDMANDGMIEREVRGKRTFMIKLVDDWGLLEQDIGYREVTPGQRAAEAVPDFDGVNLEALADTLLAMVIKRAQAPASQGAEVERLKEKANKQAEEIKRLRDDLILARESEKEHRQQADRMRESLGKFQAEVDKQPRRGGTPLAELIGDRGRRELKKLMESMPSGR